MNNYELTQVLLSDATAERRLAAAYLCSCAQDQLAEVAPLLNEHTFTDSAARTWWRYAQGTNGMYVLVRSRCIADGGTVGDIDALYDSDMAQSLGSMEPTMIMAQSLQNLAIRRYLKSVCDSVSHDLTNLSIPTEELVQRLIDGTRESMADTSLAVTLHEAGTRFAAELHERAAGTISYNINTGLTWLDQRGGMTLGHLVVIAGRTSHGKSALAGTIAFQAAKNGNAVCYYSAEMDAREIAIRMVAQDTDLVNRELKSNKLDDATISMVEDKVAKWQGLPFYIDERSTPSVESVMDGIRALHHRYGCKLFFVDYLQQLRPSKTDKREKREYIGDACVDLKNLAKELGICLVAVSQLRRPQSVKEAPNQYELKESGEIENSADDIYIVYRAEKDNMASYPREVYGQDFSAAAVEDTAMLINCKSRSGDIGATLLHYDADQTRFRDATTDEWTSVESIDDDTEPF